jgi:uncharacterized membrane protein YagU involved in acid resistance
MKNKKIQTTLIAGAIAGTLDIAGAILVYAFILGLTTPQKVLQSVAAGALGKDAYSGGWNTALAGLGFHFLIAFIFAAFFMLIRTTWIRWFPNPWVAGIIYGIVVWCIMNLGVLPIATGKEFSFNLKYFLWGIGLIIFLVGVPISMISHHRLKRTI